MTSALSLYLGKMKHEREQLAGKNFLIQFRHGLLILVLSLAGCANNQPQDNNTQAASKVESGLAASSQPNAAEKPRPTDETTDTATIDEFNIFSTQAIPRST